MSFAPCGSCDGARLRREALAVTIHGRTIHELTGLSIPDLGRSMRSIDWTDREMEIGRPGLKEIEERLRFLCDVGLPYLTLSRSAGALSGGQARRVLIATPL